MNEVCNYVQGLATVLHQLSPLDAKVQKCLCTVSLSCYF